VPGDIGLIGLNDMEMAGWQNINLTTIRQPIAAEIIERYPEARLFPCKVIERGKPPSSSMPPNLSAGDCVATGGR
jgi:DNA-binding LacI/PurR family transcriptional regulator